MKPVWFSVQAAMCCLQYTKTKRFSAPFLFAQTAASSFWISIRVLLLSDTVLRPFLEVFISEYLASPSFSVIISSLISQLIFQLNIILLFTSPNVHSLVHVCNIVHPLSHVLDGSTTLSNASFVGAILLPWGSSRNSGKCSINGGCVLCGLSLPDW